MADALFKTILVPIVFSPCSDEAFRIALSLARLDKIFFGSTAVKVVRTAGCPVLTVPLPVKRQGRPASSA
jgi:nucleotide-binding universal stress UspA family protein